MIKITRTTNYFGRTASGKGWKKVPYDTVVDEIDTKTYDMISSPGELKFWNGFMGGTCRAIRNYTYYGYVPVQITRVNPTATMKIVETFDFTDV